MNRGVLLAPFTETQVELIGLYQAAENTQAITCDRGHNLIADTNGLTCPFCPDFAVLTWVPAQCAALEPPSMTLAELQAALVARGVSNTVKVRLTKGSCGVRLRPGSPFVYGINLDRAFEAALAHEELELIDAERDGAAQVDLQTGNIVSNGPFIFVQTNVPHTRFSQSSLPLGFARHAACAFGKSPRLDQCAD